MRENDSNVNVLVSEEETPKVQKKLGRKFIMAFIAAVTGILTVFINNSSEIVSIAGLALVALSSLSYMTTEGKLDLASIQNIVNSADQIVDIVEDMDLPCLEDEDEETDAEEIK